MYCAVNLAKIKRTIWKTEWFNNKTRLEFEGKYYSAPVHYHEYLTHIYGNYMELPPVEDRKTHLLEAYNL